MVEGQKSKEKPISIDLPEITKLLIIGDSDTSFEFSRNLQNIALFEQIYHVESIFTAVRLLNRLRFAVIVIDVEADFDVVSCSKIINLSNELTRIVLISKDLSINDALELKNKGIVHAFIPIPNNDIVVHTLIVKEQASYRIQKSLLEMIVNPPLNTPLYNLVKNRTPIHLIKPYRILGIVIMQDTIVKYNLFFDYDESVDPYLLSSYLSAISMYGKHIFDVKVGEFEGLLFESISLLMKTVDDFQYIYIIENLVESKLSEVQKILRLTTRRIHLKFSELLSKNISEEYEFELMMLEIKKILKMEPKRGDIEYDNKPLIVNLELPNELLSELEDETKRVYQIEQVGSEFQLYDLLKESDCDLVILNDVVNLGLQKPIIASIKTISPSTQIIASIEMVDYNFIFDLLNQDEINYVLTPHMALDEYFFIVKKAIDTSRRIKHGMYVEDLYEFYVSSKKTEMIKTLLSKIPHSLDKMTLPILYGIFIIAKDKKFYSNYWVQDSESVLQNEDSFLLFMQALLTFSEDYGKSSIALSIINFGDSKLIVEKRYDFRFVYFIGDLDISNYDFVKSKTISLTSKIHDLIVKYPLMLTKKSPEELDQTIEELHRNINNACYEIMLDLSTG